MCLSHVYYVPHSRAIAWIFTASEGNSNTPFIFKAIFNPLKIQKLNMQQKHKTEFRVIEIFILEFLLLGPVMTQSPNFDQVKPNIA